MLAVGAYGAAAGALIAAGSGEPYPSAWDPRVESLAAFVEGERGLDFEHPVEVVALDDAAFEDELGFAAGELTAADREAAEHGAAFLRAIGLAEGEIDLADASSQLLAETTLAYYDPATKRVVVREEASTFDAPTRTTLVHELTHALQDQHFDLQRLQHIEDGSAELAARSLVEGDATLVEDAYYRALAAAEQREVDEHYEQFGEGADLGNIPEALSIYRSVPYVFGPSFVAALRAEGGVRSVDRAFSELPTTEQHVMAPLSYLGGDRAVPVEGPRLRSGDVELERGTFGAFGLYLVLAERIDPHEALDLADEWSGDEYVSYRADDRDCMRATFVGRNDEGTSRLLGALTRWSLAGDPEASSASLVRGEALLEACDPGTDADITTGASSDALSLPASRSQLLRLFLEEDAPLEAAWCTADEVVAASSVDELNDPDGTFFTSGIFDDRLGQAIDHCVGAPAA
jgi:hypothetical protein